MGHQFQINLTELDENQEFIGETIVKGFSVSLPTSVSDFGMNQADQLKLLENIQSVVMNAQSQLLDERPSQCPKCANPVSKNGKSHSNFHHVYSDHDIILQKYVCSNDRCKWSYTPSINGLLGGKIHCDLIKLQSEYGAMVSFGKSETLLRESLGENRAINNHERIRQTSKGIGQLVEKRLVSDLYSEPVGQANELIAQVDGGYIHDKATPGHDFEAMTAKVFQPQNCLEISKDRHAIMDKNCAASAEKDKQATMKRLTLSAAKAQGMGPQTQVTALADGAKNCWNIIRFLKGHCGALLLILDWFHIGKNLKTLFKKVSCFDENIKELVMIKLWKGQATQAIELLKEEATRIAKHLATLKFQEDITKTITYLENNKKMIVNYQQRKKDGLIYTSSIAESTVEHLLSQRMKKKQKMQWTREGCHAILQLRAAMASDLWDTIFEDIKDQELRKVAS